MMFFLPLLIMGIEDISLSSVVNPSTFFDATGKKASILGYQDGRCEMWIYPFKILHDFTISFDMPQYGYEIPGLKLAREITCSPEATTITYAHQSFTMKETFLVPLDEEACIVLLDIISEKPLTVIAGFYLDLLPMWPAGLGGQYSYWDEGIPGFVIGEARGRYGAIIGSPYAKNLSSGPAHNLPDLPSRIAFQIEPKKRYRIPIIVTSSVDGRDKAKKTYKDVLLQIDNLYNMIKRHYSDLKNEFMSINTPDSLLNLSFEWSKVAIDKGFVTNPHLGSGLVAGYNTSGRSERPGFAWFFGGDALLASLALNSYGDFETSKNALLFLKKYQREDGKIMHELSQSSGMIPWFEEYGYGFYHGETTPYYIVSIGDYVRCSGDTTFLKGIWESVRKAYDYCKNADTDGDGLMENTIAGLAAIETGPLRQKMKVDIYLAGIWTKALETIRGLSKIIGDEELLEDANELYEKAIQNLNNKFWNKSKKIFNFAILEKGFIDEVSVWASIPMVFGLLEQTKAEKMLCNFSSSKMSTDWGIRSISNESRFYEPLSYNNGTVWPFLTGYAALAEYKYHRPYAGFEHLIANSRLNFIDALGFAPELLSGNTYIPLDESVPHQIFSSVGITLPIIRGLFGLEGDEIEKIIYFTPHLPPQWEYADIKNVKIGKTLFDFSIKRDNGILCLNAKNKGDKIYRLKFSPAFGIGAEILRVLANGKGIEFNVQRTPHDIHCLVDILLEEETEIIIEYKPGINIIIPFTNPHIGDETLSLKMVDYFIKNDKFHIIVDGKGDQEFSISLPFKITSIKGGKIIGEKNRIIRVRMVFTKEKYERKELVFVLNK